MRYKTRPARFPLDGKEKRTSFNIPKFRKSKSGVVPPPESTFASISKFAQAKTKFLSKLPFRAYKIYNFGERSSGFPVKNVQDFNKIRDLCLLRRVLWEDPEFPANDKSLFYSKAPDIHFEWKRPKEIVDSPQFIVDGVSRFDARQGKLGDCWFLAALANLTMYRELFYQIVPEDQSFTEKYAGVFHFRFWQYGRWIDVVIDDRLPTYRGRLVYIHSSEENEFWSALIEKAYAKLHGCYEALKRGSVYEAMEDFTGGVTEMFDLDNNCPDNLFQILLKAHERSSLIGCSVERSSDEGEHKTPEGLVCGHDYSITGVKLVEFETPHEKGVAELLRLLNPWGNSVEWNGRWSDQSPEWQYVSEQVKEEMGLTFNDDGEFWMLCDDFKTYFQRIEICNLDPDSISDDILEEGNMKKWEMSLFEGAWVRDTTAGGCRNFLDTFWHNPQYRITLKEPDEGDEENKCTVIIALMQKNRRRLRKMGLDCITIGFVVYHLPKPEKKPKPLDKNFFKYNTVTVRSPLYTNIREVSCRFKLPPGTYCIVPSTYEPNVEGDFLLRVFAENKCHMVENDQEVGYGKIDTRLALSGIQRKSDAACCESRGSMKDRLPALEEKRQSDRVRDLFLKLAGEDMEIDWIELKDILDYSMRAEMKGGFSKDICRSMVAMMDADFSGKLGYEEFKVLWADLRTWKYAFKLYDTSSTYKLSSFELREALNSAGYKLNNHILTILVHRYGTKDGYINFDDFLMCAVRLKTMIDLFRSKDPEFTDKATFPLEEWLIKTVYT